MNSPTKVVDIYPVMIKVRVNMISDVFLGRNTLISSVVAHSSHSQSSHHTAVCTSHVALMWMRASDCGDAHTCEGAGDTGISLRLKPTHMSCGVYVCVCTLTLIKHMWHMYSTTACVTWQSGTMQIWHCSLKSSDGTSLTPPDRNHTCRTSSFPSPLLRSFLHSVWGDSVSEGASRQDGRPSVLQRIASCFFFLPSATSAGDKLLLIVHASRNFITPIQLHTLHPYLYGIPAIYV